MRVYRISKGWALFTYIAAGLMIILFSGLLIMPFVPVMNDGSSFSWIFLPIAVGMLTVMVIAILSTAKDRFIIEEDNVSSVGIFGTRKLMLNEIKGFTVNEKYIFIEPLRVGVKRIKISRYYGKTEEIIEWLSNRYSDLDSLTSIQEQQEILSDQKYGWTTAQREQKLTEARKASRVFNVIGAAVGVWTIFFPRPYEYAIIASILVPVIAIVVLHRHNGLIRLTEKKGSAYPSMSMGIILPAMAIMLRALLDYNIFSVGNTWLAAVSISLIFTGAMIFGTGEAKIREASNYVTWLMVVLLMSGYGFGSIITLNCSYDRSRPETFYAEVLGKRISSGKSTTYYITVSAWGPQEEINEVSVSENLYDQLEFQDEVVVYFSKGLLSIPWFTVEKKGTYTE